MYQRNFRTLKRGVTLPELLIAIFLGSFIFFITLSFYLAIQKNIAMSDALMNMQDNIRITSQILRNDIFHAGFVVHTDSIHSYEGPELKSGTNAFTIKGASTYTVSLVAMNSADKLAVTDVSRFEVGDQLVIFDAREFEIFKVGEVQAKNNIIIPDKPLQRLYSPHAEISEYFTNSYFISKTDRNNADGSKLYALYVKDIHGRKEELVEGICNMRILYSILKDEQIFNVSESQVADWSLVRGVSFSLELNSVGKFHLKKEFYLYVALRDA